MFEEGLDYAKALRHSVARVAPAVVRAGCVHNASLVRWIEVDGDVTDAERRLFAQPIALADLGRMLIRVHRDSLRAWRSRRGLKVDTKPLIITLRHGKGAAAAAADGSDADGEGSPGYITVMGIPVPVAEGMDGSANFLDAFRRAAEETGARFRIESFDSSTMLIDARDLPRFLEYLDPGVAEATA
jgi:hypothetical protein